MIHIDVSLSSFQTKRIGYVLEKVLFFLAAMLNSIVGFELANNSIQLSDILVGLFISALGIIYFNSKRMKYTD